MVYKSFVLINLALPDGSTFPIDSHSLSECFLFSVDKILQDTYRIRIPRADAPLFKEEFNSLALEEKSRVKAHFLGSYEWGKVSSLRNRTPYYTGVRENGRIVATALVLERSLVAGFTYFYIPRGFTLDYSDRELLKFMTESIRKMGKKHRALYFRIDPDIKLHTVDIDGNVIEGESNEDLVQYLEQLG